MDSNDGFKFIYVGANVLVGTGMISIACAILYSTFKRRSHVRWLSYLFGAFFIAAGLGRLSKGFFDAAVPGGAELVFDGIGGLIAIGTAILIWPLAIRSLSMPSYTDLKKATDELASTNRKLEIARDHALEASELKSSFVANISHELRTPLSAILGMSELVLSSEPLTPDGRMMMKAVFESGQSLLAIVNDILDVSKIEAGKIHLETKEFAPAALVEDCLRLLERIADGKGLRLESHIFEDVPATVIGDPVRVRQVLTNLIANAIKFTQDGVVRVEVARSTDADERAVVQFSVTDTGIGISPEEEKLLFVPFTQVDNSSTRKFGGTGLGLTISKKLVEMMSGELGVNSAKGKGSTFWFDLPFDLPESERKAA